MQIIDLLNKIANGEEIPKIIKYDDKIYYSNEDRVDLHIYQTEGSTTTRKLSLIIDNEYLGLNEEVEIIEKPKKIEKLDKKECRWSSEVPVVDKINELIDVVNELKEG